MCRKNVEREPATARTEESNTVNVLMKGMKANPTKKADGILLFTWDSRDTTQRLGFSHMY